MTITEKSTTLTITYPGKLVDFFGLPLNVPKGYKWVAMDESGFIYGYEHKPEMTSKGFNITSKHIQSQAVQLGQVIDYVGDWRHSRIKVKQLLKLKAAIRT